jgi:hypothetical protein
MVDQREVIAQAERGELINRDAAVKMLRQRRARSTGSEMKSYAAVIERNAGGRRAYS